MSDNIFTGKDIPENIKNPEVKKTKKSGTTAIVQQRKLDSVNEKTEEIKKTLRDVHHTEK